MPLEKSGDILRDAYKKGYGIAAFNVLNYEMIKLVIQSADALNKPVLVACYPGFSPMITMEMVAEITSLCAKTAKTPVGLHLDHSTDYGEILRAMQMGYTSVMYDGSTLPFEENIKNTAEVVKAAKALNIDVEAELGHVGSAQEAADFTDQSKFTLPQDAKAFCEATGCSSLAVAVGNAHGDYIRQPHLDIGRIQAISQAIDMPLVLHGGSGIPNHQVQEAVKNGIAKMNVGTEYFHTYYHGVETAGMSAMGSGALCQGAAAMEKNILAYLESKILLMNP